MFGPNIKHSICYICPHLDICISLNSLDAFFAGEFPRRGRLGLRSSSASTAAEVRAGAAASGAGRARPRAGSVELRGTAGTCAFRAGGRRGGGACRAGFVLSG